MRQAAESFVPPHPLWLCQGARVSPALGSIVMRMSMGMVWRQGGLRRLRPRRVRRSSAAVTSPPLGVAHKGRCAQSPCERHRRPARDGHEPRSSPPKPQRDFAVQPSFIPSADHLTPYEAQAAGLEDPRPHPPEAALQQLGCCLMTELLDVVVATALEDFHGLIGEALIGAFHTVVQRIERDADRARDALGSLVRDFDGSEVLDVEIQAATAKARSADVAMLAMEIVRDAAAASYATATGEVWSPWKGSVRASRLSAAQIDARDALRAARARRHRSHDAGATIVALRAAPQADTAEDAGRLFDALNWAHGRWPDMALATSGAKGAEKLAVRWAQQKGVALVLAKADFDRYGRAAPFRANDEILALEPVCILTLATSVNAARASATKPFGPALSLAQKAAERGLAHHAVRARR